MYREKEDKVVWCGFGGREGVKKSGVGSRGGGGGLARDRSKVGGDMGLHIVGV